MRPLPLLTAAILACLFATATTAAAQNAREQWLVQTRAADAVGEVLMEANTRGEAQVDALRNELVKAGQKTLPAASGVKSPATRESQAGYRALVEHVAAEVRRAGAAGVIDPWLENLSDGQLFEEMAAVQSYNLRQFRRLAELREQEVQLRHRFNALRHGKAGATTQPAIAATDQLAREAVAALNRPQPGPSWAAAREKMRNAIATSRAQPRRGVPRNPAGTAGSANRPFARPANAIADDPRWQPYYYGPTDPFSGGGGWGAGLYDDPFQFRGGGGVYERYDMRVNADSDTRTRAQPDRRVNVQFDRRLNVHVDPRQNF